MEHRVHSARTSDRDSDLPVGTELQGGIVARGPHIGEACSRRGIQEIMSEFLTESYECTRVFTRMWLRYVRSGICYRKSVCRLSVCSSECNVPAPYSTG